MDSAIFLPSHGLIAFLYQNQQSKLISDKQTPMMTQKTVLIALCSLFVSAGTYAQKKKGGNQSKAKPTTTSTTSHKGIDLSLFDRSVRPNDDFYQFVNGTWLKNTAIPADKTRWGSFDELRQKTDKDMLAILREAIVNKKKYVGTDQEKAINLFETYMDTVARNKVGIAPLTIYFKDINSISSTQELLTFLIKMEPLGGIGFIGMGIGADEKDSNKNSITIYPGRVGLPDRDYYVSDDKDSKEKRDLYRAHVARMFGFLDKNPDRCKELANRVVDFETKLSEPRLTRAERRDSRLQYNPMSSGELMQKYGHIEWKTYFRELHIEKYDEVIVSQPRYMERMDQLLAEGNIEDWKAYLTWSLLNRFASILSTDVEKANFEFYGKKLTGALKQRPRDERALQVVNGMLGESLGQLYVEKKFPKEAKDKALKMIDYLIRAYNTRINGLAWMTKETRKKAIEKLEKITIKVGYPDTWKKYDEYKVVDASNGGSYFTNYLYIARASFLEDVQKLDKPVDKKEWGMSPQTVNAYYNPSYNEIVFPAAILQPPFYDYKVDEAVNFGGIGAVIGHEISHGFDDSGAQYDANGNLEDWWSAADLSSFKELGNKLADQYSALEPLPGIHVDGKFTLGENIGDLGGINAAYDALQLYLKEHEGAQKIDGFTPQQRLFLSWATIWRGKIRDEALKNQVKTDPHSPAQYRGYVPLRNLETFHRAFDIKEGDKMYLEPKLRVIIW